MCSPASIAATSSISRCLLSSICNKARADSLQLSMHINDCKSARIWSDLRCHCVYWSPELHQRVSDLVFHDSPPVISFQSCGASMLLLIILLIFWANAVRVGVVNASP